MATKAHNFPYPALEDPLENETEDTMNSSSMSTHLSHSYSTASAVSDMSEDISRLATPTESKRILQSLGDDAIRVVIRVRPPNQLEKERNDGQAIFPADDKMTVMVPPTTLDNT